MDNPEDDKTTINVKSVRKPAWEAARREAAQRQESMGTWLSDAIDQRIARGVDEVQPPGNLGAFAGNPSTMTPDQVTQRIMAVAALQQSAAALKQAKIRSNGRTLRTAQLSLEHLMIEVDGPLPTTISGKANGKELASERQSGMIVEAMP